MTAINLCCNRKCKETRRFIKSRVGRDSVQVSWHICAASIRPRRCNNAGIQSIQSSRATLNHTHGGPFKRDQGDLSMSRLLSPSLGSFQQMENVWSQDSDPQLLKHKLNGNGIRPTEIAALGGRGEGGSEDCTETRCGVTEGSPPIVRGRRPNIKLCISGRCSVPAPV